MFYFNDRNRLQTSSLLRQANEAAVILTAPSNTQFAGGGASPRSPARDIHDKRLFTSDTLKKAMRLLS